MELQDEMMLIYPPSLAAKEKAGELPPGFAFYEFRWIGKNPLERTLMEVTGAVFREATRGPNRGKRTVIVKETQRTVYVTADDIRKQYSNCGNAHAHDRPN